MQPTRKRFAWSRKRGGVVSPDVVLGAHQERAVHQLVSSDQKGLLIWHMMGTGKTLSALVFAMNCPGRRIVVFCPEALVFMWKGAVSKLSSLRNEVVFYAYESSDEFFAQPSLSDDVLILDEAQHLVSKIRESADIRPKMELLKTAHKVLALSGTPIYTDILDLAYIVNICAGKKVLSYNDSEFRHTFYRANWKSYVFGYRNTYMAVVRGIGDAAFYVSIRFISDEVCEKGYPAWLKSVETHFKKQGIDNRTSITLSGGALLATFYLMLDMAVMAAQNVIEISTEDLKSLDAARLAEKIAPYVSYHKNRPGSDPDFPRETMHYAPVSYSFHQLDAWLKLTANCLGVDAVADLNIASSADARYYAKRIEQSSYLSNGIVIGNLKNAVAGEHSPKFHAILKKARGKRAVFYSSFAKNGILALAEFLKAEGEPHMYLDKGLNNVAKEAMLEDFYAAHETGAQCFLLLHPSYSEGISVRGAQQLHILEPIQLFAKKMQVVARTSRYLSHAHLPAAQRRVDVFQWYADVKGTLLWLRRAAVATKEWRELTPEVSMLYAKRLSPEISREEGTPDSILVRKERRSHAVDANLTAAIAALATRPVDCCIRYPSAVQEAACMRRTQRRCREEAEAD